jgi:drug/metabolite transporter (DMT)-like permease
MILKRTMSDVPPAATASATMATSALLTLPLVAFDVPNSADWDSVGSVIALGVLGTGLAFLIFYTLINELGPARASIVAYLAPGFSVGYGVALLGESITAGTIAGLVLILIGSWLGANGKLPMAKGDPPPAESPPPAPPSRTVPSRSSAPAPVRAR